MKAILLVALGGGIGAVTRFKLGAWVFHLTEQWRFPAATFVVNVLGCFVAGLLAGLVEKLDYFTHDARLFLFTGLLGGFTTFSAFGLETYQLIKSDHMGVAFGYVTLSILFGVAALWLGFRLIAER